jgi:hypothetical protein
MRYVSVPHYTALVLILNIPTPCHSSIVHCAVPAGQLFCRSPMEMAHSERYLFVMHFPAARMPYVVSAYDMTGADLPRVWEKAFPNSDRTGSDAAGQCADRRAGRFCQCH